jgi:DNA-binding GntR family transcriptional regulator
MVPIMSVAPAQKPRPRSAKPEPAQDVVFAWLKKHVVSLPRTDGTFLTEAEVCRATGMSRTPVREALLRLEADGLLRIVPKKGAFVPPITELEVEAIMQARGLVEDFCVRRAVHVGESLALELDRLLASQEKHQKSPLEFIELDREFHRAIVRAAHNPVLADFYESLRDRQMRMGIHAIATSGQRTASVLIEHRAIAEGVRSGDADQAAASMALHLRRTLAVLRLPSLNFPGLNDPSVTSFEKAR